MANVVTLRQSREENNAKLQQINTEYASNISKLQSLKDKNNALSEDIKQYESQIAIANQLVKEIQSKIDSVAGEFFIDTIAKLPICSEFANLSDKGEIEKFDGGYLDSVVEKILDI